MYCILIYLEYKRYVQYQQSNTTIRSITGCDSNKKLYFNPNCLLQLLLEYILKNLLLNESEDYDFCNENGECIGIKDYKSSVNGLVAFRPQETYYVVLLIRNPFGAVCDKVPILNPMSEESTYLLKRFRKKLRRSSGSSTGSNKKKTLKSKSQQSVNLSARKSTMSTKLPNI